jgi:hypothetical protein
MIAAALPESIEADERGRRLRGTVGGAARARRSNRTYARTRCFMQLIERRIGSAARLQLHLQVVHRQCLGAKPLGRRSSKSNIRHIVTAFY